MILSIFNIFKRQERLGYNNYFQIYSLTPEEKNEYLLSTLYFYFRCYSEVYENIKFLINDIKTKSTIHYNSAYELRVISNFLLNPIIKETDFITAYQNYIKNTQYHQAAKSLFNLMKVYEQKGNFSQLINIVMKGINEIPNRKKENRSIENMVFRFAPLMYEETGKKPIILLDDVFSELDEIRRKCLIKNFKDHQVIITSVESID